MLAYAKACNSLNGDNTKGEKVSNLGTILNSKNESINDKSTKLLHWLMKAASNEESFALRGEGEGIIENISLCRYFSSVTVPLLLRDGFKGYIAQKLSPWDEEQGEEEGLDEVGELYNIYADHDDQESESKGAKVVAVIKMTDASESLIPSNGKENSSDPQTKLIVILSREPTAETRVAWSSAILNDNVEDPSAVVGIDGSAITASKTSTSLPKQLKWLSGYEISSEKEISNLLGRSDLGGSFTSLLMMCREPELGTDATTKDVPCETIRSRLVHYQVVVLSAMSLSPTLSQSLKATSLASGTQRPRFLNLGLGGGEFHSFLYSSHPHLHVDTVELSENVVNVATSAFGFNSVCAVYKTDETITRALIEQGEGEKGTNHSIEDCRSRIFVSNGWNFLSKVVSFTLSSSSPSPSSSSSLPVSSLYTYNYIYVDIFGSDASAWNGVYKEGISNIPPPRQRTNSSSISTLQALRLALDPHDGLLFYHIHMDSQFDGLVQEITKEFEEGGITDNERPHRRYIAIFYVSSNDRIIVASRRGFADNLDEPSTDRFKHPCDDIANFSSNMIKVGNLHGYPIDITLKGVYTPFCF